MIDIRHVLGAKILIVGDVGTGKTRYTAELLKKLIRGGYGSITIIDMAPEDVRGVGGSIKRYMDVPESVVYLRPHNVFSPRLRGKNADDVLRMAELNRKVIEPLIDSYINNPTPILVINDITIYLHRGDLNKILRCIDLCDTFIGNAYYGSTIIEDHGSGITQRERNAIMELLKKVGFVVNLNLTSLEG